MKAKKINKLIAYFKLFLLIGLLVGVPVYIWFFHRDFLRDFSDLEYIKNYLQAHGTTSAIIYLITQAGQIVVCFIPGQWLQIAAAYLYGIWIGILFSIIGAVIGSFIAYYLAEFLGRDAVHMLFGKKKVSKMVAWMQTRKASMLLFIIFLLPGVPKDATAYVAGIADFPIKRFLVISTLGRIPAMMGSLIIGYAIASKRYGLAIIIGIAALILFLLGVIYRNKIDSWINHFYEDSKKTDSEKEE